VVGLGEAAWRWCSKARHQADVHSMCRGHPARLNWTHVKGEARDSEYEIGGVDVGYPIRVMSDGLVAGRLSP